MQRVAEPPSPRTNPANSEKYAEFAKLAPLMPVVIVEMCPAFWHYAELS
jgi:hypothetical protein